MDNYSFFYLYPMKVKDSLKEEKIKQVVLALVAEGGLEGLNMKKIAKSAGITPSMIYTYFNNKEELLVKVYIESTKKLASIVFVDYDLSLPLKQRLFRLWERFLDVKPETEALYNYIIKFENSPFLKEKHYRNAKEDVLRQFYDLVEEGQKSMMLKNLKHPELLIDLSESFLKEIIKGIKRNEYEKTEELKNEALQMLWDAFRQ